MTTLDIIKRQGPALVSRFNNLIRPRETTPRLIVRIEPRKQVELNAAATAEVEVMRYVNVAIEGRTFKLTIPEAVALQAQISCALNQLGNSYEARLLQVTSAISGFSLDKLRSKDRTRQVTLIRHIAMYLIRQRGISFPHIGHIFAKDHGTVMFAVQRVTRLIKNNDRSVIEFIAAVEKDMHGND